jgi:type VI secretion system protein VasD
MTRALLLVLIALAAMSAACGKLFGPKQTTAAMQLHAAASLNPDDSGRPSPLRIRLYELKSTGAFNGQDFFSLYERDKDILGPDLVAREEIQVEPGMEKSFTRALSPDTKFLAVLAPYRNIERAKWRASMEVRAGKTTPIALDLDSLSVNLGPPPKNKK